MNTSSLATTKKPRTSSVSSFNLKLLNVQQTIMITIGSFSEIYSKGRTAAHTVVPLPVANPEELFFQFPLSSLSVLLHIEKIIDMKMHVFVLKKEKVYFYNGQAKL